MKFTQAALLLLSTTSSLQAFQPSHTGSLRSKATMLHSSSNTKQQQQQQTTESPFFFATTTTFVDQIYDASSTEQTNESSASSKLPAQWASTKALVYQQSATKSGEINGSISGSTDDSSPSRKMPTYWQQVQQWASQADRPTPLPESYQVVQEWAKEAHPSETQVSYQLRNTNVVAAAEAGTSRWGTLENDRAMAAVSQMKATTSVEPVTNGATNGADATVATSSMDIATIYEKRNAQVVAAAAAGKSRWGPMESNKLLGQTSLVEPVSKETIAPPVAAVEPPAAPPKRTIVRRTDWRWIEPMDAVSSAARITKRKLGAPVTPAVTKPVAATAAAVPVAAVVKPAVAETKAPVPQQPAVATKVPAMWANMKDLASKQSAIATGSTGIKVSSSETPRNWQAIQDWIATQPAAPALPSKDASSEVVVPAAAPVVDSKGLYDGRNANVAAAAKAGKSRWGDMENNNALVAVGEEPVPIEPIVKIAPEPVPVVDTKVLFDGRNANVAAAANAGKSRWGDMENNNALVAVGEEPVPIEPIVKIAPEPVPEPVVEPTQPAVAPTPQRTIVRRMEWRMLEPMDSVGSAEQSPRLRRGQFVTPVKPASFVQLKQPAVATKVPAMWANMKELASKQSAIATGSTEVKASSNETPRNWQLIQDWIATQPAVAPLVSDTQAAADTKPLYDLRNTNVAAAAKAGKSRWGDMENNRALEATGEKPLAIQSPAQPVAPKPTPMRTIVRRMDWRFMEPMDAVGSAARDTRRQVVQAATAFVKSAAMLSAKSVETVQAEAQKPAVATKVPAMWSSMKELAAKQSAIAAGSSDVKVSTDKTPRSWQTIQDWVAAETPGASNPPPAAAQSATTVPVYELRNANVALAAQAGKSRWGELENQKVIAGEGAVGKSPEPIVVSTVATVATEAPVSPISASLYELRNSNVQDAAIAGKSRWGDLENERVSSGAIGKAPVAPKSMYELRNNNVVLAAQAGKSRWGELENQKTSSGEIGKAPLTPVQKAVIPRTNFVRRNQWRLMEPMETVGSAVRANRGRVMTPVAPAAVKKAAVAMNEPSQAVAASLTPTLPDTPATPITKAPVQSMEPMESVTSAVRRKPFLQTTKGLNKVNTAGEDGNLLYEMARRRASGHQPGSSGVYTSNGGASLAADNDIVKLGAPPEPQMKDTPPPRHDGNSTKTLEPNKPAERKWYRIT